MAYFLATNVLSDTPPVLTPCIVSSGSQLLTIPTIDGHQPYVIDTKIRLPGASPSAVNSYFLGNGHDTSNGGGWYLRFTNGGYNTGGGWIRLYDSHGTKIGDINPPQDIWFDVLCGPKRTKFFNIDTSYDTMPGDESIKDYKLSLFGITQSPISNLSSIAIARTKITLDDVLVADLVPVNAVNTDATVLLDNAEFLGYGYQVYSANLANITPIRDTLRLRTRYLDTNGVMHYGEDYTIAISNLSSASWDVRPYTTFDDGKQVQWVIQSNKLYYQQNDLPTGAVKVFADVTVSGTQKEGGFYDTVNNKYYFSETSTPLVYSEL